MNLQKSLLSAVLSAFCVTSFAQKSDIYLGGDTLIQLGIVQHDKEKYEEALDYYSKVNSNDDNYPLSLYEKALTYNEMGKKEEALQTLQSMEKYPNSLDLSYYNLLGSVLDDLNRRGEALKIFESVYPKYEHTYLITYNYALTYYHDGKLDEARALLEKNVRLNPFHFNSHATLGKIHFAQGRLVPSLLSFAFASTVATSQGYAAFKLFENALNGSLKEEIKTETGLDVAESADDELNQPFKELEFMLKSYVAGNRNFTVKAKIDYSTTRQFQFLIENITVDPVKSDAVNQVYIPFFSQLVANNMTAPGIYYFVRFSDSKDIVKALNKNKAPINKYIEWAAKTINEGREQLFDPKSTTYCVFNRSGIEGKGSYSDVSGKVKSGTWIFYHDNGEKAAEGVMQNNKKEDVWTFYNGKGNVSSKVFYKNDLPEGELVAYNENGTLYRKSNYKNGKEEGESFYFNQGGFPLSKMTVKDDKIVGLYTYYYDNGNVDYTVNYVNGKLNGSYAVLYANGTQRKTGSYKEGELDGIITFYYANGKKWSEQNFKNGKLVGIQQSWHPNGKLENVYATNEEEKTTGVYKEYYSNGQLSDSVMYVNGLPQGTGYFYDRDGKLLSTVTFDKKGARNLIHYYDKNGKIVGTNKKEGNKMNLQMLNPNGNVIRKGLYKDNKPDGVWEYFDVYGNLTDILNYKAGELNGEVTSFYAQTGKPNQKSFYKDGKRNGFYTQYYPTGNVRSEGYLVNGEKEGEWKTYYPNGQVVAVNFYKKDEYHGLQSYYSFEGKKSRDDFFEDKVMTKLTYYTESGVLDSCSFTNGYGSLLLKYPNGKTYRECSSVKGGKYNGELTVYNVKGDVVSQSMFIDGLLTGKRIFYNDDKEKTREDDYLLDQIHGKSKFYRGGKVTCEIDYLMNTPVRRTDYYPNGKKSFECSFNDNGLQHGWVSYYDEAGELQYEYLYEDGLLIGYGYLDKDGNKVAKNLTKGTQKIEAYYQNGNKSLEVTITNGWREGALTRWHSNGKLKTQTNYLNNEETGEDKEYSREGVLIRHRFNQYDNLHGLSKKYSDSGVLLSEEEYVNGDLHGTCKYYHANGKLRCTRIYDEGLLIAEK